MTTERRQTRAVDAQAPRVRALLGGRKEARAA